jgi:Winged helix DNA-binding domain
MTRPVRLSWDQVLAWRLRRQFVDPVGDVSAVDVVQRLCGVQAQVTSSARLAIAVRQRKPSADEVPAALAERTLFRTWAMRGTLHLLCLPDAAAYLALLTAGRTWLRSSWQRTFITEAQLDRLTEAVRHLLDGGRVLSRDQLVAGVRDFTGDGELAEHVRSGWSAVLKPLAWQGYLCSGPSDGNRVSFASPESWLPGWSGLPRVDEAARQAVPAYLGAYGPASPDSFGQWLSRGAVSKAALRRWFTDSGVGLSTVDVDGRTLFARAADVDEMATTRPVRTVRLLPGFDQYVLGPGTGDPHIVPIERRAQVSKAAGWISPVVVLDGRVAGVWEVSGSGLSVTLFEEVPVAKLKAEAARLGELMGEKLRLITVRG